MLKTLERLPVARRAPDLTYEFTTVTPDIVRAWLDKNKLNRKLATSHVKALAHDMKAGDWRLTGDAIRFDTNGDLIDGQHRLHACIEANVPFPTFVLYGLGPDVKVAIDLGKSRTAADFMTMSGLNSANHVQAAARHLLSFKSGIGSFDSDKRRRTVAETLHVVAKHKALIASVRVAHGAIGPPVALVAALHYVGAHLLKKPERADAMIEVLKTGVPNYLDDPMHRLRERILLSRKDSTRFIKRRDMARYLIHAWNNFAMRTPLEVLKLPNEPIIKGLDVNKI